MNKQRKRPLGTLTSLDGKRTISARQFDQLFDAGSDEIDRFIDWSAAEALLPGQKKPVSLRLDRDILEWFKSFGAGYQTHINAVLRTYKRAREKS
jgi:uncharacterized protein (DUF4415 family)